MDIIHQWIKRHPYHGHSSDIDVVSHVWGGKRCCVDSNHDTMVSNANNALRKRCCVDSNHDTMVSNANNALPQLFYWRSFQSPRWSVPSFDRKKTFHNIIHDRTRSGVRSYLLLEHYSVIGVRLFVIYAHWSPLFSSFFHSNSSALFFGLWRGDPIVRL